jgi:hypothetical protein
MDLDHVPVCRVTTLLGFYVLNKLTAAECHQVQEHLARCGPCRLEFENLREIPRLLELLSFDDVVSLDQPTASEGPV